MLHPPRTAVELRRDAHIYLAAALSTAGAAAVVLYLFPPSIYGFYPICPVYKYLHLQCPGCGTTRAFAELLHGHFANAFRLNALAVGAVFPVAMVYGAVAYSRAMRGGTFRWPQPPMGALYAGIGVITAFTVLRNL